MAVLHVWMSSISENTEVGRPTVTNPRAVKSFLCKKYLNIKNILVIAGSCKKHACLRGVQTSETFR